ncbi:MAG: TonB-dependent receptor plug domain-containing protein, partial [Bacteroidetes bacterium]|nr:TonB-dependent receptor plug domain-containing protein [Bacteroidota bacterium]
MCKQQANRAIIALLGITLPLCISAQTGLEDSTRQQQLREVTIQQKDANTMGMSRLRAVEGMAIYEGKKSEVVRLDGITANLSTNNARQVFARVAGLNIWESDGAGLQLGIGGRGLSPNRTSNFNTRQNGYDMSADALGYPESYYTPPTEALSRIEVVRGAASLQYGTQFGGMLNFVTRQPGGDRAFRYVGRQTVGSYGFINTFNSIRGNIGDGKMGYYAYFQHKQGDGWRPNAGFGLDNGFVDMHFQLTKKL